MFPFKVKGIITTKDYKCIRCGITRDKVDGNVELPEFKKLLDKWR